MLKALRDFIRLVLGLGLILLIAVYIVARLTISTTPPTAHDDGPPTYAPMTAMSDEDRERLKNAPSPAPSPSLVDTLLSNRALPYLAFFGFALAIILLRLLRDSPAKQ